MLNNKELESLMFDIESDRVERTISTTDMNKFSQAVCAFANDMPGHSLPGYLLIGVRDDGKPCGLKVTDELLVNLGGIRADGNVLPQPAMNVAKYAVDGGEVAVVEVLPSDLPPVRYRGRIHVRTGPRKTIASEQEERILLERRIGSARSFDARPCLGAGIDELSMALFESYRREAVDPETVAANHRPVEFQLASLRLYDPEKRCLTHAGVLLFGKNPRFHLPGGYVQYLRFPGTNLTDVPDDQIEISGDLYAVLRELEVRLRVSIQTRMRQVSALGEKKVPDYPEWALRELLMNAVMHRNYDSNTPVRFYVFSDHMEIQNPGGLYGEATPGNFPTRNSYRNPVIAEAMKALGFVNRFGYGVQRAQALLKQNGNPPAQFEFDEHAVLVKVYQRPQAGD
jgi:ATP-dependent DNA helicase RecG